MHLKVKKPVVESQSSSSATPEFTYEPIYDMPPNSFLGQTPPPSSVYATPIGLVSSTGQTDPTGYPTGQTGDAWMTPSPTPLEMIPGSAASSQTNELSMYTPPRTTTVAGAPRGSGPYQGPFPTSTQTMTHTNTNAHRPYSDFYTMLIIKPISLSSKRIWLM